MTTHNKGFVSLYISLLTLILVFNGCEDPGSVGSGFINEPSIVTDTLTLDNTASENFIGYTGNFSLFSIGSYSDQLFGDVSTVGLLKPVRSVDIPDSLGIVGDNFSMKLEIQLDSLNTYGDTLFSSEFSIYEVSETWRGNEIKTDSEVTYNSASPIGSFTIGQEKNIIVDLNEAWKDQYYTYFSSTEADADSTYRYEFHGLAIVPQNNTNKISFVSSSASQFLILSPDESDTVSVGLNNWAYLLERNGSTQTAETTSLHTTIEEMMRIDLPLETLKAEYSAKNILSARLLVQENTNDLTSTLAANHTRPNINLLNLHLGTEFDESYEYQLTQPEFSALRDTVETDTFKSNITLLLNNVFYGSEVTDEIYVGIGSLSGVIRSTQVYNGNAPEEFRPKLIISYIVNE
ncbi:hypothetical protein ACKGJO_11950 [Gracilimonas sp. Q87]|uniref:hypothetical protein n=1 Tax=Gracilimonas sp. Q87 TaxID=3384766 RepID=UPI003983ED5A